MSSHKTCESIRSRRIGETYSTLARRSPRNRSGSVDTRRDVTNHSEMRMSPQRDCSPCTTAEGRVETTSHARKQLHRQRAAPAALSYLGQVLHTRQRTPAACALEAGSAPVQFKEPRLTSAAAAGVLITHNRGYAAQHACRHPSIRTREPCVHAIHRRCCHAAQACTASQASWRRRRIARRFGEKEAPSPWARL